MVDDAPRPASAIPGLFAALILLLATPAFAAEDPRPTPPVGPPVAPAAPIQTPTVPAQPGPKSKLADERLLVPIPPGYRVVYQNLVGHMLMQEFIPDDQTIEDWTEMVTVQMFWGAKAVAIDEFIKTMRDQWASVCPNSRIEGQASGLENGYPDRQWAMQCPISPSNGKPEFTWFKAIQGTDNFYVVQKAFKFEPGVKQKMIWTEYLQKISACDMRTRDHPCPDRIRSPSVPSP